MKVDDAYFFKFAFTKEQIKKNFANALRDLNIAKQDKILEVKFNYAYTSFIKIGIALLSQYNIRVKSVPGHHAKLIEKIAQILKDDTITDIGNIMRSKRNRDLYAGGIEVTEKECREYIKFVEETLIKAEKVSLK